MATAFIDPGRNHNSSIVQIVGVHIGVYLDYVFRGLVDSTRFCELLNGK